MSSGTWSAASAVLSSSSSRVRFGKEELGVAETFRLYNLKLNSEHLDKDNNRNSLKISKLA